MNLIVFFDETGSTAYWKITGSTGVYARLSGNGTLVGTPLPDGIHDEYTG